MSDMKTEAKNDKYEKEMKNVEGHCDPTATELIKNESEREGLMENSEEYLKEKAIVKCLIRTIFSICNFAGYRIESRLVFKNMKTGKIWK